MNYDPRDWYWVVGGDETRVFASARGVFVQSNDKTYQDWVAKGGVPSRINSKAELGEVLAPYLQRPQDEDVLDGYKEAQASKLTIEGLAKLCFHLANEVRELKGQQPVDAAQFKTFLKGLM